MVVFLLCITVDGPGSVWFPNVDTLSKVGKVTWGTLSTNLAACMLSSNSISSIERDLAFKSTMKDLAETRFVKK